MRLSPHSRHASRFALAGIAAWSALSAGEPPPAHPAKEETYTITAVLELANPVDPAVMNDDFQDARVLQHNDQSWTVEVTYYPLTRQTIGENFHWREEDGAMAKYLHPTPTENWDAPMQQDLLAELHAAGIHPEQLSDRKLVQQVSRWAFQRASSTSSFGIWAVYFPAGQPEVYPPLRAAFDHEKPSASWPDQRMFDREVLGRSMYYDRIHGACTSSSIYLSTILRALGIPTRMIVCIPPFDPNDRDQAERFYRGVHQNHVRAIVHQALDGMQGFADHFFNEVYLGHRWVRLNYTTLGQPSLDRHYFGLLTHILTTNDLSALPLAATWGLRYFANVRQPALSSENPYRLVSITDHFGTRAQLDNPQEIVPEFKTVTIAEILRSTDPKVPGWVRNGRAHPNPWALLLRTDDWVRGAANPMRTFLQRASHALFLVAAGCPDIALRPEGSVSSGGGEFQAFMFIIPPQERGKIVPGARYTLRAENTNEMYRWQPLPSLAAIELVPDARN